MYFQVTDAYIDLEWNSTVGVLDDVAVVVIGTGGLGGKSLSDIT